MDACTQVVRLWQHCAWADVALLAALREAPDAAATAAAWREYAHVLGAEAVWLARLRGEPQRVAVWPDVDREQVAALADATHGGYAAYVARLDAAELGRRVAYTNSAGQAFESEAVDILLQVMLHGQYHRGRMNLLLRQADAAPAPVDYIAYVRGVPAATSIIPSAGASPRVPR